MLQTPTTTTTTTEGATAPATSQTTIKTITIVGADGVKQTLTVPLNAAEVDELRSLRQDLTRQLIQASGRRTELNAQLFNTRNPASIASLQERISATDQRIVQIEKDLASNAQRLAAAPAQALAESEIPRVASSDDDMAAGVAIGGFSTAFIIALVAWYRRRRRRKAKRSEVPVVTASDDRLERLERGMEAIAIEIERISEGQRFVTKVMSESRQPAPAQLKPESL